jgi:hypothetical protein
MKLSTTREVTSWATTQKLPSILWNINVHYRVHKSAPLVPILNQTKQSKPPHHTSRRSILILSTHLQLGFPNSRFLSGFPTKNIFSFLAFVLYAQPIKGTGKLITSKCLFYTRRVLQNNIILKNVKINKSAFELCLCKLCKRTQAHEKIYWLRLNSHTNIFQSVIGTDVIGHGVNSIFSQSSTADVILR